MAFVSAHPKLIGTLIAAVAGGLAVAFPAYSAELALASGTLLGWLHLPRPGDVKAGQ